MFTYIYIVVYYMYGLSIFYPVLYHHSSQTSLRLSFVQAIKEREDYLEQLEDDEGAAYQAAAFVTSRMKGSYEKTHRLDGAKTLVNVGINYRSLKWWSPDFWIINSIIEHGEWSILDDGFKTCGGNISEVWQSPQFVGLKLSALTGASFLKHL